VTVSLLLAFTLNALSNHYIASPPFLLYLSFGYVVLVALICPVIAFYFGIKYLNLREPPNPYGGLGGILTMLAIFVFTLLTLTLLGWSAYGILLRYTVGSTIPLHVLVRFIVACGAVLAATFLAIRFMRMKTIEQLNRIEL